MTTPKRPRKPQPDRHATPRRLLSQPEEDFREQDEVAREHGVTWGQMAREALARHMRYLRRRKPTAPSESSG